MIKEKWSIETIAAKREVSVGTIMGHLEKLKSLKMIDDAMIKYLIDLLAKEDFDIILSEFKNSQDGKLKPVYEKFNGQYSYEVVQLVRLFS